MYFMKKLHIYDFYEKLHIVTFNAIMSMMLFGERSSSNEMKNGQVCA